MIKLSLTAAIALLAIGQGYGQYTSFNNFDGKTQQLCVRDMRLRKAALLLEKGGLSVTEVMYSVGFSNPSYFTRCFQEAYGTTPSDYKSARS